MYVCALLGVWGGMDRGLEGGLVVFTVRANHIYHTHIIRIIADASTRDQGTVTGNSTAPYIQQAGAGHQESQPHYYTDSFP